MSWEDLTAAQQDDLLRRPFDHFGRYRLAAELVTATAGPDAHVLDLGGGPGSLQAFLPDARVVSTDIVLPGEWHAQAPDLVLADGARLPFADDAFDVVVSLDTLEHVVPASRQPFLDEVARVAGRWALVVCPYATPGVADADQALRDYVAARFAPDMPTIRILDEHLGYGHPDLDATVAQLRHHGDVDVLPSGRLDRWFAGMLAFFHLLALGDDEPVEVTQRFINRTFYAADLSEPAYRHAVLLRTGDRTEGGETDDRSPADVLQPLRDRAAADPAADAQLDLLRIVLTESLVDLTARQRADHEAQVAELQARVSQAADARQEVLTQLRTVEREAQAERDAHRREVDELLDRLRVLEADRDALREFHTSVTGHPAWRARGIAMGAARTVADRLAERRAGSPPRSDGA